MKDIGKVIKNMTFSTLLIILSMLLFWMLFVVVLPFALDSKNLGNSYGGQLGSGVGTAIGSFHGLTSGYNDGKEDGINDALDSKDDIEAAIENSVQEIGKLEVLVAGFSVQNFHEIGKEYASLELLKGNAVFTVDLNYAEILFNRDGSHITVSLNEPDVDLYINENDTEQLAEYQKYPWSGSAENGYKAYLNSRANSVSQIKDSMENYDTLMESAKNAAIKEITRLASAVCAYTDEDSSRSVTVTFKGGN